MRMERGWRLEAKRSDFMDGLDLVRFPNSLAFGSELGLQYPYRRGIFLCGPVALPILAEHGQMDAYWVREHLRKLQPQSHFCSLTGLGSSTPFLSSASLQLLPETDISLLLSWICHFQLSVFPPPVCNFCWRKVRLYFSAYAFQISFVPFYLLPQLGILDGIDVPPLPNPTQISEEKLFFQCY